MSKTQQVKRKDKKKMPRTKATSFERNVEILDKDFNFVTEKVSGEFNPAPKSFADAVAAFGSEQKALDALDSVLRAKQILKKITEKSGGIEVRYVLKFIKPYRQMAPFDNPTTLCPDGKEIGMNKKGDDIDEGRQTSAILAQVKTIPFLLDGLKDFCAKQALAEEEGENDSE